MTYGFRSVTFAHGRDRPVLLDATLEFDESERVSVLVPSGGGKTTMLDLLAGHLLPLAGTASLPVDCSWPIGTASIFHPAMSPETNVRSLSAMCGENELSTAAWVSEFAQLGDRYFAPLSRCSSGERARLAYAFSYSIGRRFYVAEDSPVTGDTAFMARCEVALRRRLDSASGGAGLLLVTRNPRLAAQWGDRHAVLAEGRLIEHTSADAARSHFADVESGFQRDEAVAPAYQEVG